MLRPWLFVGFSGHRHLANPELIVRAIGAALDKIAAKTSAPLAAVSSAASGADTLFAEESVRRALPWTLLLPFGEDEFKKDFPDVRDWQRVERLLPRAARRHEESPAEPNRGKTRFSRASRAQSTSATCSSRFGTARMRKAAAARRRSSPTPEVRKSH
jgi:hypothetical protein